MPETTVRYAGLHAGVRFLARLLHPVPDTEEPALHPFRPGSRDEVPEGAWRDLEARIGRVVLDRLFVVPQAEMRPSRGRRVTTATEVLAIGDDGVALWTHGEGAATVAAIPAREVLAVDDRQILLHGRLSIIGTRSEISVRYNTVARDGLRPSIAWLRDRIAGPPADTSGTFVWLGRHGGEGLERDLPYKWAYVLACSPDLRIDGDAPAMVAVGNVAETPRRRRTRPATGIAILGPRELVVAAEPAEYLRHARYGVDLTCVPRRFVHGLGWDGRTLHIALQTADGARQEASITRPLDGQLFEAMRQAFRAAVRWS